jgi:hypothetical protein
LKLYGAEALAEIALTRKHGDAAVGGDSDPAIDLKVVDIARGVDGALRIAVGRGSAKADHHDARGFQKLPPGGVEVFEGVDGFFGERAGALEFERIFRCHCWSSAASRRPSA